MVNPIDFIRDTEFFEAGESHSVRQNGESISIYYICSSPLISVAVPSGPEGHALYQFIARSVMAGQQTLRSPMGVELVKSIDQFAPHMGFKKQ